METEASGWVGSQPVGQGQGPEPRISDSQVWSTDWKPRGAVYSCLSVPMEDPGHSGEREILPPKGWRDVSQDHGGHRRSWSQEA